MKYFIAIALLATVASAAVLRPLRSEIAEIQEIIAAIQSPSTNPATAAALEEMLLDALGLKPEPVAVGPAIVDSFAPIAIGPAIVNPVEGIAVGPAIVDALEPISVGPAIVDFPQPDGGAAAESIIAPSPVSVVEGVSTEIASGTPLVQIILNINQATADVSPEVVEIKPEPVHVVESAAEPVQVVEVAPTPVQVVEVAPVVPVHPIGVVAPEAVEPVQIGVPVIPEAAVILPEELN